LPLSAADIVTPTPETPSTIPHVAWVVARDVNRTVGGGVASMELMRRSLGARGWLTDAEHALLIAVSRLTPGTNLLAYCATVGWTRHGLPGAVATLTAASLPSAVIAALLSAVLARVDGLPAVQVALAVLGLVAAALVLSAAWHLLAPFVRGRRPWWTAFGMAAAGALALAGVTPIRVLLVLAVWGALTPEREAA
jgi:chromate transporter